MHCSFFPVPLVHHSEEEALNSIHGPGTKIEDRIQNLGDENQKEIVMQRESRKTSHLISINAPPPTPLASGLTTPRQRAVATAASTAVPPSLRTSRPITEHRLSSAATTPMSDVAMRGRESTQVLLSGTWGFGSGELVTATKAVRATRRRRAGRRKGELMRDSICKRAFKRLCAETLWCVL
jgi:hypothetical protein